MKHEEARHFTVAPVALSGRRGAKYSRHLVHDAGALRARPAAPVLWAITAGARVSAGERARRRRRCCWRHWALLRAGGIGFWPAVFIFLPDLLPTDIHTRRSVPLNMRALGSPL